MVFLEDVCDEFTIKPPKPPKPAPPPGRILREPGLFQFNKK
jgi:hypothetical protein